MKTFQGISFEAFIGALYLDTNYETCEKIVLEKLFTDKHIEKLENKIVSYKGLLLEWSQKKKVTIKYEITEETLPNKNLLFKSCIYLNNVKYLLPQKLLRKKQKKKQQRAFYSLNKKNTLLKNKKIFLDLEMMNQWILVFTKINKKLPDHEIFFEINKINPSNS